MKLEKQGIKVNVTMDIRQLVDELTLPLVCMVVPGIFFLVKGIRVVKNKETLSVGRDAHFRWKKPVILKGHNAIKAGYVDIFFGAMLLLLGLCSLLPNLL